MALSAWALPRLAKLMPLDDESLNQIIMYSESLPPEAAAEHLKNLLGDSSQALEFISTFNSRRQVQAPAQSGSPRASTSTSNVDDDVSSEVPRSKPKKKKKPGDFNKLPPVRRPEDFGQAAGGYVKGTRDDYMAVASPRHAPDNQKQATKSSGAFESGSLQQQSQPSSKTTKLPPSAAGKLISDPKPKVHSSAPPKAKTTKVSIAGGVPMQGQSTALTDLDSAIRTLEVQTNPSLTPSAADNARRRCNCMATRHELLTAAPNCLSCGKIICVKEGLGPCTFCGTPLLSAGEIDGMIRSLREERGKEKMVLNNAVYRRAEVSQKPRAFASSSSSSNNNNNNVPAAGPGLGVAGGYSSPGSSAPPSDSESKDRKLAAAVQHRDKLLSFQAQNARRTRVYDEAADFETPTAGQNMWASPAERALQLKKQQKALREQEWSARPEWEKRRVVASIDLAGGKIVRRMAAVERPPTPESDGDDAEQEVAAAAAAMQPTKDGKAGSSTFGRNPLLGKLIRPVVKMDLLKGKEKASETEKKKWRRVQDDDDDNEKWILDGGLHGSRDMALANEEPECG